MKIFDFICCRCPTDYFKITDNTGTYTGCGWKKYAYDNVLCSSVVYISYKAPSSLSSTIFKGFQAYYECLCYPR